MTNLCEQFNKISNYSSEEVLCCEQENEIGSCKVSSDKSCINPFLLAQCRKISDLGKACERDDEGFGDKELTDKICSVDNNNKWLCLATNDTRNSDLDLDLDAQRNWVITGRLFNDRFQPAPSRNSLVDSSISCGACCNNTACVHMSSGNYKGSCLNADGFNKWCRGSGNWTAARVKCPDMFLLGDQNCQVVPFSSDNPILRQIAYRADLCDGFVTSPSNSSYSDRGLTTDGKVGIITTVVIFVLGAFVIFVAKKNRKWLQRRWRKSRGKEEVNNENVPSEQEHPQSK